MRVQFGQASLGIRFGMSNGDADKAAQELIQKGEYKGWSNNTSTSALEAALRRAGRPDLAKNVTSQSGTRYDQRYTYTVPTTKKS